MLVLENQQNMDSDSDASFNFILQISVICQYKRKVAGTLFENVTISDERKMVTYVKIRSKGMNLLLISRIQGIKYTLKPTDDLL